ncbi:hypothetical protein V1508DRAFT_428537, partial [Lipomyces doorenjongii]|uniref:uncharacterized protein n=1 Tax=Lipomyces doorenjongii TaxID=383834 RepID=UPI0034CFB40A
MESPIIPAGMSRCISPLGFASYSSKPIVPGVEYESILQEASLDSGGFMTSSDWRCHANTEHHISLVPTLHIQPRHKQVSMPENAVAAEDFNPETQTIEVPNYVFGDETRFGMTLNINRAAYLSFEENGDNGRHHKEPKLSQSDIGTEVHPELDAMNPVIVQANKRRRGRPRFIPQHSRAERRRAQIRDAQRTYRERKDKTMADLNATINKLQSTIDSMRAAFLEIY